MSKFYDHERLTLAAWAAAESCQPSGKVMLAKAVKAALARADRHDEAMGIHRLDQDEIAVIRAEALEEAARSMSWFGAQGNLVHPDTAWAGVCACMTALEAKAATLRSEAAK